jgi:serine/threonine protein phosphatase PrpC
VLVDLCEQACSLQADDRVLLASDGLLTLSEADIAAHLGDEMAAELPCQRLLAAVAAAGYPNQDNTTVIVVQQGARTRWNVSTWVLLAGLLLGAVLLVMSWLWHWGTSL